MAEKVYKSKYSGEQIDAILGAVIHSRLATFKKNFLVADWTDNTIQISYDEHCVSSPTPSLFRLHDDCYEEIVGGITINLDETIVIQSDMPFDGKIIIK